ncbi:GntR domain protein [Pseudopedobacter saltans DSM 12145]|uniref:GntR domain protein n=1 Tax=Pseudopedobacter saltans (strain ATCC 51119 / DSM 12145 / JCM 21818 / CCUG 39354 / LMG 10337 / NBRC 100064 / NCIMB 13643) TaxID=762903 RepID=F0SD08_PSESL|nr:FCD domain-containing protein [Pseudopedobacter saltans]ADY51765.1 GntR domain protein [Pseudopedobacter saltans DSM 12145]
MNSLIDNIKAIQVESPVDKIIGQLKQLISSGQLKPGDRLPSERALSERFGLGRSYVREALLKLEFYGLLRTNPQSGTYVAGLSINVIENIISDIIKFNKDSFNSLVEARCHLEFAVVKLAAERRSEQDLAEIREAMEEYERKIESGASSAVEEDMIFHIKVAKATKSSVLESMILFIIPDLIKSIVENNVCGKDRGRRSIPEHRAIYEAIVNQDPVQAEKAMVEHLDEIWEISKAGFQKV